MLDSLHIQKITVKESQELAHFSASTFYETFASCNTKEDMDMYLLEKCSEEKMAAELSEAGNHFFFARLNSEIIGHIKLRTSVFPSQLQTKNCIEIERIYVASTFQGKKIGAQLMQFCLNYAKDRHFSILWLAVWEHNSKAYEFYKKWGFEKFGDHIFILGKDNQNDILLKKTLF
jgi:GNAT superfamily N-acetyltransferase